jgi:hypothetical protein
MFETGVGSTGVFPMTFAFLFIGQDRNLRFRLRVRQDRRVLGRIQPHHQRSILAPRHQQQEIAQGRVERHLDVDSETTPGQRIDLPGLALGRSGMENAASRMSRGKNPIRHHVRRTLRQNLMKILPRTQDSGHSRLNPAI